MNEPRGNAHYVYHFGGHAATLRARAGEPLSVFTEDAFGGRLTATDQKPRERAPFPRVNPLTGPIAVEGAKAGEVIAVHLISLAPARSWGVSTISPNFGALSGTRSNPNLQPEQDEKVWIWRVDEPAGTLVTQLSNGMSLAVPLAPFHGIIGVAPPHGEVRLSVVPDSFGGNLDLAEIGAGATLYLRANVPDAHVYIGDGHYAQGDGELAGTAVEGAMNTRLVLQCLPATDDLEWPRIETDDEIGVIGCARPLEDAARIATAGMVRWLSAVCRLSIADAHQFVSQACRLRIGNLVNPAYSVAAFVRKDLLPTRSPFFDGVHDKLRAIR